MESPFCDIRTERPSLRSRTTQRAGFRLSSLSLALSSQCELQLTAQPVDGDKQQHRTKYSSKPDRNARIKPLQFSMRDVPASTSWPADRQAKLPSHARSSMHAGETCIPNGHASAFDHAEHRLLKLYMDDQTQKGVASISGALASFEWSQAPLHHIGTAAGGRPLWVSSTRAWMEKGFLKTGMRMSLLSIACLGLMMSDGPLFMLFELFLQMPWRAMHWSKSLKSHAGQTQYSAGRSQVAIRVLCPVLHGGWLRSVPSLRSSL